MRRDGLALLLGAALCAGCGDGGPPVVPVKGRVTLDGKPLALKSVRFVPQAGTAGLGSGANTAADGSYTLIAVRPGATRDVLGAAPGSYRVVVTEPMFPIESVKAEPEGDVPAPAIGLPEPAARKRPVIPPVYTTPEHTPLQVEVPREGGVLDLALKSRP